MCRKDGVLWERRRCGTLCLTGLFLDNNGAVGDSVGGVGDSVGDSQEDM